MKRESTRALDLAPAELQRVVETQPGDPASKAAWAAEECALIAAEALKESGSDRSRFAAAVRVLGIRYWRTWRARGAARPTSPPAGPSPWAESEQAREHARSREAFEAMSADDRRALVARSRASRRFPARGDR